MNADAPVYRWIKYGIRGGVRLEVVKIGGATYTSKEALQDFANRSSDAAGGSPTTTASVTASRQRQIDRAAREVEKLLGRKPKHRGED